MDTLAPRLSARRRVAAFFSGVDIAASVDAAVGAEALVVSPQSSWRGLRLRRLREFDEVRAMGRRTTMTGMKEV